MFFCRKKKRRRKSDSNLAHWFEEVGKIVLDLWSTKRTTVDQEESGGRNRCARIVVVVKREKGREEGGFSVLRRERD